MPASSCVETPQPSLHWKPGQTGQAANFLPPADFIAKTVNAPRSNSACSGSSGHDWVVTGAILDAGATDGVPVDNGAAPGQLSAPEAAETTDAVKMIEVKLHIDDAVEVAPGGVVAASNRGAWGLREAWAWPGVQWLRRTRPPTAAIDEMTLVRRTPPGHTSFRLYLGCCYYRMVHLPRATGRRQCGVVLWRQGAWAGQSHACSHGVMMPWWPQVHPCMDMFHATVTCRGIVGVAQGAMDRPVPAPSMSKYVYKQEVCVQTAHCCSAPGFPPPCALADAHMFMQDDRGDADDRAAERHSSRQPRGLWARLWRPRADGAGPPVGRVSAFAADLKRYCDAV